MSLSFPVRGWSCEPLLEADASVESKPASHGKVTVVRQEAQEHQPWVTHYIYDQTCRQGFSRHSRKCHKESSLGHDEHFAHVLAAATPCPYRSLRGDAEDGEVLVEFPDVVAAAIGLNERDTVSDSLGGKREAGETRKLNIAMEYSKQRRTSCQN